MENIGTQMGFCSQTADLWQMVGYGVMIAKIVIPVMLILIGIVTLGKAVISTDEKEIKKSINQLLKKFVLAVCILFIPAIVNAVFGLISGFDDVKADYLVCQKCVTHPNSNACLSHINSKDAN